MLLDALLILEYIRFGEYRTRWRVELVIMKVLEQCGADLIVGIVVYWHVVRGLRICTDIGQMCELW
jgi:hypothetical protein